MLAPAVLFVRILKKTISDRRRRQRFARCLFLIVFYLCLCLSIYTFFSCWLHTVDTRKKNLNSSNVGIIYYYLRQFLIYKLFLFTCNTINFQIRGITLYYPISITTAKVCVAEPGRSRGVSAQHPPPRWGSPKPTPKPGERYVGVS